MKRPIVWVTEPHEKSMAALVLLQRQYEREERQQWFDFRDELLDEAEDHAGEIACFYCGRSDLIRSVPFSTGRQPAHLATIDHVVPVSKGGPRFEKGNCVIACYSCNQKKADGTSPFKEDS